MYIPLGEVYTLYMRFEKGSRKVHELPGLKSETWGTRQGHPTPAYYTDYWR
jgi:hypothetical protein